jgi:endonuclease/exonuclease/phosphatase (EEP) superfamily protein YafD
VRVQGCEQDFGDTCAAREPHFKGYYTTGVVQYHTTTKHFRYVRIDYDRATVVGANSSIKGKETAMKEEMLNAIGWSNYLFCYTLGKKFGVPHIYSGLEPKILNPDNYNTGLLGGTDEWRALQWNVRSMNPKTRAAKKRIIRDVAPLVTMINEGRQEINLNDYNGVTSLPAAGAHRKRNAQLLIHRSVHMAPRRVEVDYVSAVATGHPFAGPTLLVCLYLNGYRGVSSTAREETLQTAEDDIADFVGGTGTHNNAVIVGGDLNTTAEEMEVEAVNGSWFFEYLLGLHRSTNNITSHHRDGNREIDYVFSDMPLTDLRLHTPHIRNLSDHDTVCVTFTNAHVQLDAQVPDRKLA